MNEDILQGKWNELKGSIQEKWGKLTDDDMTRINGDRIKLAGTIQKNYGIARDEAEKQLKEWEDEHRV
ncbi:MAG: CsbD family protein [Alphaproteobacteria bacterium]|nr:CsbD family protein [Alphaproteobacteria bacterium]MCC7035709.1 CsbD family protein [Alphaproteobacteria bacterium]